MDFDSKLITAKCTNNNISITLQKVTDLQPTTSNTAPHNLPRPNIFFCLSNFRFIIIITKENRMEHNKIIEYPFPEAPSDRSYHCPCGKVYKSYPALYTHIKNKHQGQAPGPIRKPSVPSKKRGRPVANRSNTSLDSQFHLHSDSTIPPQFSDSRESSVTQTILTAQKCLLSIKAILEDLPTQDFNNFRLNEISAVAEMVVFMSTKDVQEENPGILVVVSQFLSLLSEELSWQKSKPFYILVMVFLQYILSVNQQISQVKELVADNLCEYLNDFIQAGAAQMAQLFLLSQLRVFETQIMTQIFSWFFRWMFLKNYSTYRIILNSSTKRNQTQAQF